MTVQLNLPKVVGDRLLAEVRSGKYSSIEDAIMERLMYSGDAELLDGIDVPADQIRRDLKKAWTDREGAVDGDEVFQRLLARKAPSGNSGQ